jgi:hypothetical protein
VNVSGAAPSQAPKMRGRSCRPERGPAARGGGERVPVHTLGPTATRW